MRTTKQEKTETKEVKQELTLKEAFVLWRNKSEKGNDYLSGFTSGEEQTKLVGFFNTSKKNPKEPDVRVYTQTEKGENLEVASLWANVSKNDNKYLTGSTNENEKLVAFYGKENEEKRPYIRVYYKEN